MSVFGNIRVTMDQGWGIATGELNDGNAVAGRSVGYAAAATTTTTPVLATTYTPQSSAAQRSLKSSSASDGTGGTGALTVAVNYMDNTMTLHQEIVTLNGTTAVNMVSTTVQYIESMVVQSVGTGGSLNNVGVISIFTGTNGTGSAFASIAAGDNSTFYAHHYVPAGVSCYIIKHTGAGTLSAGGTFMTQWGDPRSPNPVIQTGDIIVHLAGGTEDHEYEVPLVIPGPGYIRMFESPVAATTGNKVYASFDWVQD